MAGIQDFIDNFNGGTRKNRFRVKLSGSPDSNTDRSVDDFHIQAAAMPASIITTNPIDYQGRKILYPGDRIYSADGFNVWTMTVLDDTGTNNIWKNFHAWSNKINGHDTNTGNTVNFTDATITVEQLNLNETGGNAGVIKRAKLFGCWPKSVGPIEMEMQARDQYNSFDVTICFKYIEYQDLDGLDAGGIDGSGEGGISNPGDSTTSTG
jgi:hypothetical protein